MKDEYMHDTYKSVQEYYGKVLQNTSNLKTSACTAAGRPSPRLRQILSRIPQEVLEKFYGCGAPLPEGIRGLQVLDLGSGSGRDCYAAAALVGESGLVTGIDMTAAQLQVAEEHARAFCLEQLRYKLCNMRFIRGHIEYLDKAGIQDSCFNLIISNCVVNLSPDKHRVLSEAYRVLTPGGEMYFSDVYCDRRLPAEVRQHEVLWGECISGALYIGDFMAICRQVGFSDPRRLAMNEISIRDPDLKRITGNARFYSITYRLFKLPGLLEPACEDYGQLAIYKGTVPGSEHLYNLDEGHSFVTGKPALVCGNTAAMLGDQGMSWLSSHFQVTGDRTVHYGAFACNASQPGQPIMAEVTQSGKSCCS